MVLNLSGDMQISTPHTRFFRLFYCSPKQGDIYSGINIRIHIVPAMIALERLVIPSANMMALGTSLGSICWWNDNQRYSIPFSFVFNKIPKLGKTSLLNVLFPRLELDRMFVKSSMAMPTPLVLASLTIRLEMV